MTEKKTKGKMSPKILLEKNKERENRVSEEKERRRSKKKQNKTKQKNNGCTPSFYVDLCLRGELYFGFNVIQKSSSDIYFSYPCAYQKSDLKRIYFKI